MRDSAIWGVLCGLAVACGGVPPEERPVPAQLPFESREVGMRLPMDGAENLRDLGGYRTNDGHRLAWGRLYRSDELSGLSDDDVAYLDRLALQRVVDFRSGIERERDPDRLPAGVEVVWMPIEGEGLDPRELGERLRAGEVKTGDAAAWLIEGNRAFVREFHGVYGPFLRSLADADNLPTLFHCTAGKDRAGYAAALVLLAAGAPRDTVMRDYLLTNHFTERKTRNYLRLIRWMSLFRVDPDDVRPLFEARGDYLGAAFETIDSLHGSTDAYLRDALGVDVALREKIRKNLLD